MKKKPANFFLLLLCINISSVMYAQQTNVQDSLALVALYNSTDGKHWYENGNWLKGPVSTWEGITVTDTRVTKINLDINNLTGYIPLELGNLTMLSDLNLDYNHLSGSIPAELGNLSNLLSLDLGANQLTGDIPPELGELLNLQTLELGYNELSGGIRPEFGNFSDLLYLDLASDQLSGIIPPELGNLSKLNYLSLENNQLSGGIPPELGNLSNLMSLSLELNQLSGSIPPELGKLTNLGLDEYSLNLDLGYNQLTGNIPPELGKLVNLKGLNLRNNQLTGNLPPELANLVNLGVGYSSYNGLLLDNNQLTGNLPAWIGNFVHLQQLVLNNNQFSGNIPPELGNLANLNELNLSNNRLSGSIPAELGNPEELVFFYLNDNQLTGSIPPELGKLQYSNVWINLSNNQLSGAIPPEFADAGDPDAHINISNNRLTFEGLEFLLAKRPTTKYSPQANIPVHLFNDSSLYVSAGGILSNNTYKWFRIGQTDSTIIYGDSVFYPSQDGKYYAAVTNLICKELTLHTDTIEYGNAMPVTIINLQAQLQGKFAKLSWTSVTETNVSRYEIQRSANTVNFMNIGSVIAEGNGTAKHDYSFNDLQPQQGNNYYRLKIFDKDGKTSYSVVVSVNINNIRTITIVYPNPAKNILHIQTNSNASFSLINQSGKILLSVNINGSGTMNVSSIAAGLYYLKNDRNGEMQKIMIVR